MAHHLRSKRWGGPWAALAAVLALAAGLRLTGVQYGLPFGNLLNPDEQSIAPRAWRMTHGGGPDPDWFDYPALLMYLLAPLQWFADAPSYLSARLAVVALGLGAVAATWWLGRVAFGTVAAFIAAAAIAVETTHVAYSRMAVTDVPLTLGVAGCLALLVSRRLELAGLVAGLAMGVKYPGLILLVPLAVAGYREPRRLRIAVLLAGVGFAATNPFFFAHWEEATGDAARVQRLARQGWLGFESDHAAPLAFLDRLWEGLGPFLLVALAGLVAALVRRRRTDLVLASFVLAYFASLMTSGAHFDRYVLPLVPPLVVLGARFRWLAPVSALLLLVPFTWSIRESAELTKTDVRIAAHAYVQQHVPPAATLAVDPSTPPFARRTVIELALPGPGREPDPNRDVQHLRELGVEYVLVTGAVADRVLAARDRYPRETRFYDQLQARATRLYYAEAKGDTTGPWVALFRL